MTMDLIKTDPLTGKEVMSVFGGEVTFAPYAVKLATDHMKSYLEKRYEQLQAIGSFRGCPDCDKGFSSSDHFMKLNHLSMVLLVPRSFVERLCAMAFEVIEDELPQPQRVESPLFQGTLDRPVQMWRGGTLEGWDAVNQRVLIQGARGAAWQTARMEATCANDRDTCLEHLRVNGDLSLLDKVNDGRLYYYGWDRRMDTIKVGQQIQSQWGRRPSSYYGTGSCSCGIYGYKTVERLERQHNEFCLATLNTCWGYLNEAEDGYKVSDCRIEAIYLLEKSILHRYVGGADSIKNQGLLSRIFKVDLTPLAEEMHETYGVPVYIVDSWRGLVDYINRPHNFSINNDWAGAGWLPPLA